MKLRKIMAALLAVATLSICAQPCFAVTVEELIVDFPKTMNLQLPMEVSAKKTDGGSYEAGGLLIEDITSSQAVDYKASLDMQPVRDVFSNPAMDAVANSSDAQLRNEFLNGTVETEITVVIDYPDTAETTSDFRTKGALVSDNNIFEEKSRDVDETAKRAVIKFKNRDNTKVRNLIENQSTYFEDLAFVLEDEVKYSLAGEHTVSITLSGSTVIDFASREQIFAYNGQASHIVTVTTKMQEQSHLLKVVPAVPPTCFKDGATEGVICSIHNKYCPDANGIKKPNPIEKLNHKVGTVSQKIHIFGVLPSCIAEGVKEHWTCALCKSDFATQESDVVVPHENHILPKEPHTPQVIPGVQPTCNNHGYAAGSICSKCGLILQYSVLIPATGIHTEVPIKTAVAADCETSGNTAGKKCSVCDTIIEEAITIPATGHNYGEWVVTKPATDTAEGSKERVCKNNSAHKEVITIPKTQHVHSIDPKADVVIKEATCKKAGKKQQYCACGLAMGAPVEIPALPHALTHVDAVAATCVSKGNIEYWECGRQGCGKTFRDQNAIYEVSSVKIKKDKDAHQEIIDIPGIEATCAVEGLTSGKKCKACNNITQRQEIIPKEKCEDLKRIAAVEAECEKNGVKEHWHCTVCDRDYGDAQGTILWKEKDFFVPATGHNYAPAVKVNESDAADADGNFDAKRVCRNDESHIQYLKMPAKPVCDHEVGETLDGKLHITDKRYTVVVKEPTCTEEGLNKKVCHLCGVTTEENIVVPKLKHDLEKIDEVKATCHMKGTEAYWKCKHCDKLFDGRDSTKEITAPKETDKITEHAFEDKNKNLKICKFCGEKLHVNKKDKDGNDVEDNGAELIKPAHVKDGESDAEIEENKKVDEVRKDRKNATVDNYVIIEVKEEVSKEVDENIQATKPDGEVEVHKLAYDIDVEKVTTYNNGNGNQDKNIQEIKETEDLVIIRINIPVELRQLIDFLVHRKHEDHVDIIKTTPNADGEFIEIAADKSHIILHVKKFSEYAVVGYDKVVNVPETPVDGGSGGSSLGTPVYTVEFKANGGAEIKSKSVNSGATIVLPIPVRAGYVFAGWYTDNEFKNKFDPATKIKGNVTLYAKWEKAADIIVDFGEEDGIIITHQFGVNEVVNVTDVDIPFNAGKIFGGFYYDAEMTKPVGDHFTATEGTKLYTKWIKNEVLNDSEHFAYIIGYPVEDGTELVRPEDNITREEVATVFYRLLKVDVRDKLFTTENDFHDVLEGRWSNKAISTMANGEFVDGYAHGGFEPSDSITRAEFVTIASRLLGFNADEPTAPTRLLDAKDHWADEYINFATALRWIDGYEDETFKPDKAITRAEVMKIVNSMLNRCVNEEGLVKDAKRWTDNSADAWYYYEVIEATNSHSFERIGNTKLEKWTAILENEVLKDKSEMEDA